MGEESFSEIVPDPLCQGIYGQDESVDAYLRDQGVQPFIYAADRYLILFLKLFLKLKENPGDDVDREEITNVFRKYADGERKGGVQSADMDTAVEAWCREAGIPFPQDVEQKTAIHIMALESWALKPERSAR